MARSPRYTVKFRRRRSGKTNYQKRLALLKSGRPRLVIKKSNKTIYCQIIEYKKEGDRVITSSNSNQLKKHKWKHSTGNIPSAYLTGLMLGNAAKKKKIKQAILDIGRAASTKGSVLYAALKGVIDSGIDIPHNNKILPTEDRIKGKHITNAKNLSKDFEGLKNKIIK